MGWGRREEESWMLEVQEFSRRLMHGGLYISL